MPNEFPLLLRKLTRISREELGALDASLKLLGKYDGSEPLSLIISGGVKHWWWRSATKDECLTPNYFAITLFVSHAGSCGALNPTNEKLLQSSSITGLMIGNIIFLKDRYKTTQFDFKLTTEDDHTFKYGQHVYQVGFRGIFDLRTCSYYYVAKEG